MAVRFRISGLFPSQPSPSGDSPALPTAADVAGRIVSVLVNSTRPNHTLLPMRVGAGSEIVSRGSRMAGFIVKPTSVSVSLPPPHSKAGAR